MAFVGKVFNWFPKAYSSFGIREKIAYSGVFIKKRLSPAGWFVYCFPNLWTLKTDFIGGVHHLGHLIWTFGSWVLPYLLKKVFTWFSAGFRLFGHWFEDCFHLFDCSQSFWYSLSHVHGTNMVFVVVKVNLAG
jgi:hypothetical protein